MTLWPYATRVVHDRDGNKAFNATGTLYAVDDVTLSTPLTAKDALGAGIAVTSDEYGVLNDFLLEDHTTALWKTPGFAKPFVLVTSAPVPGEPGADGIDGVNGAPGRDGSNVVPTAQAIADELSTEGTPARTALNATIADSIETSDYLQSTYAGLSAMAFYDKLLPRLTIGFGDSITEAGSNPNTNGQGERSYFAQAAVLSQQQIQYFRNAGVAGNTVEQMWARIETDVIAHKPDRVIFMGGTNNLSLSQTSTREHVTLILDRLLSAGIWTAVISIPPADGLSVEGDQKLLDHNSFLKAEALKRGMAYVDVYTDLVDPATGNFKPGYSADGLHPSISGARIMGQKVADALAGRYPAAPRLVAESNADADNLLTNGTFVTDATVDGIPDGWVFGANSAGTLALLTETGVAGKAAEITRTASTGSVFLTQNIVSLVPGDKFELAVRFKAAGAGVQYNIYALAVDSAGAMLSMHKPVSAWYGQYDGYVTAYLRGVYPAGATRLQFYLHTGSGLGSVRFAQPKVRKLTA